MNSRLPSVGVATTSTNSLSRGYPALLACVDSWSKWADQIVIVDGGTTDNSYAVLKDWTPARNYEIFHSPETYWNTEGCSHPAQCGINMAVGLDGLETDWAFIVPADHVLDIGTVKGIREELARYDNILAVRFARKRLLDNGTRIKTDEKWYALNLKKIRAERLVIGFGFDRTLNRYSDYPLLTDRQTLFVDPVNGVTKKDIAGSSIPLATVLPLTCWSYGFYFYTVSQALNHLREFYTAFSVRLSKRSPKSDQWHLRRENLDSITSYDSKEDELKRPHIPEVKRLVEHFYHPEMIGGAIKSSRIKDHQQKQLGRALDYVSTLRFMMTGFRCIQDVQVWSPLGDESQAPLDVKALYKEQDRYLPPSMRINWSDIEKKERTS